MDTAMSCVSCLTRQMTESVEMSGLDAAGQEKLVRRLLQYIAEANWNVVPVIISQQIQRMIRAEAGDRDPYQDLKDRMNTMALQLLPTLEEVVRRHANPREAAVRAAIAGNLLDAGSKSRLTPEELPARMRDIWNMPLVGPVDAIFQAAQEAKCILYIADNAGEIVFDRLLLEALPTEKVTVVVRGMPVLNDATLVDAEVAGIPELVPVMSNGSDAPGTVMEQCSTDFRLWFHRADLIIAKGQGNFETLCDMAKKGFCLFTVKCPAIAARAHAAVGDMVIWPTHVPEGSMQAGTHAEKGTGV